ncbi:MAG: hypothetical protein QM817_10580 [Archangium sp.]
MKKILMAVALVGAVFSSCGTMTSTSTSSASCCLGAKPNSKYYSCPSSDAATMCFNNGSAGSCTADTSKDSTCN